MSIFTRDRGQQRTESRSTINMSQYVQLWRDAFAGTSSGVYVTEDSALRHDAVWSCVTKISQDVAMMPRDVVRYTDRGRQAVTPVPQIIAAPSVTVAPLDWVQQVVMGWLTAGNTCGRVTQTTRDGRYPTRIELLPTSSVAPDPQAVGRVLVNGQPEDVWPIGPIWHVPAYTVTGSWWGLSPIAYHRQKIGAGLAAEQFGSEFFAAGGLPVAVLLNDGSVLDPHNDVAVSRTKQKFMDASRNREPVLMPAGIKYEQVQIDPNDSQFIETMRYTVEQVCRIYNEDPADHGASSGGASMTYANRSDADLARYKRRQFWVVKLQDSLTALLPAPQVVRLNTSATLMMTPKERHEVHQLRLRNKTATINEVREVEDEPPFDGDEFDEPGIPITGNHDTSAVVPPPAPAA